MKNVKILLTLLFAAASGLSAAAEPKSDAELVQHLKSQVKCEKGKNPICTLKFRGLELEFSDLKNPSGGAISVIELGETQKYSDYGRHCILIEFMDRDLLFHGAATRGTGIIFRDDGSIMPHFKNNQVDGLCQ